MKIRYLVVVFGFCIFLISCISDENNAEDPVRPTVTTTLPDEITGSSARLRGTLSAFGDYEIFDHGFVWSIHPKPTLRSEGKVSLGARSARGEFTSNITGLAEGVTYYVRAFATDELGTVYDGDAEEEDEEDFDGKTFSTLSLSALSFAPTSGKEGQEVIIKGNNFSLIPSANKVEFGTVTAAISRVTTTQITVKVPEGIEDRDVKIYITVGGKTAVSYEKFSLISGVWKAGVDFPGGRRKFATTFTIADKGYLFAGEGDNGELNNDLWELDKETFTWTKRADFPRASRRHAIGFSIGSKGYVGTGENDNKLRDFWEYDPAKDVWTRKADFAGTARSGAVGFAIIGKGYVVSGNDGTMKSDAWEYDPTSDTWTSRASFPGNGSFGATCFVLENKGFVGTGLSNSGVTNEMYAYDPISNTWSKKAEFAGTSRYLAVGFSLAGKGFIGTGYSASRELSDLWEYDITLDKWYVSSTMEGSARYGASAISFENACWIGTGKSTANEERDFWEFGL